MDLKELNEKLQGYIKEEVEFVGDEVANQAKTALKAIKDIKEGKYIAEATIKTYYDGKEYDDFAFYIEEGFDPNKFTCELNIREFPEDKLDEAVIEDAPFNEDLLNDNIIKASENMGVQDMINMLLHITGSYVPEKTLKTIKDQFTLALASQVNEEVTEEVNETKELAGEKVEYLFDVQVTMDAENEMSNAFVKTEIQRAIENTLDKYDVKVSVQNA